MARDIDQENSEVRTLILNTLQAEERAMESDQDSMDSRSEYDEMNATYDVNEKYNPENDDEQIRLMQVKMSPCNKWAILMGNVDLCTKTSI